MPMKIVPGDILVTKKAHPCGGNKWIVIRTGADFVIKCEKCDHQLWISRIKIEKSVVKVIPKE